MNSMKGTIRLVYEDALWFLGKFLFLYITIPLMIGWILIELIFGIPDDATVAISVPAYLFISMFAVMGFRSLISVAVAFGGTRIQLLKVFYGMGLVAVFMSILLLNILQYILIATTVNNRFNIMHPATFTVEDYNFFSYLWIDLMIALFLFGISFLIYCISYRLGMKWSLVIVTMLILSGMFLYYGGVIDLSSFEWIWNNSLEPFMYITLVGLLGLVSLFVTYPLMRNAPLNKSIFNAR
ncbi:hypothetical protein [Aliicoccus persicus]|uniref:ABC-2 type transport system permease protein n=1 Tax=Aliicoccus persicus TaxID=930138 RepID=A0A662Z1Z3_9STAP|nr:hypothetical protein [Aliicoccus persicus]SEV91647.1 hypothetical protein SAMN05192557_0750 [Aliicoccus persicus]